MADPEPRRGSLPSLGELDLTKVKRDGLAGYSNHQPSPSTMAAPPLPSPSTAYSGPPPPYSYPSSASSSVVGTNGTTTSSNTLPPPPPPSSAPISQHAHLPPPDEKDLSGRQPLPSITEALSVHSMLSAPGAPPRSPGRRHSEIPAARSNIPTSPRYSRTEDEYASRVPLSKYPPGSYNSPTTPTSHSSQQQEGTRPTYTRPSPQPASQPTSSYQPRSPPSYGGSYPAEHALASPARYHAPSELPPPPSHHSPYHQQSPSTTYSPSSRFSEQATPYHAHSSSRGEDSLYRHALATKDSPPDRPSYGESVKRQLEIYDLETSLNEIAEGSGRALEFSRRYRVQAHQTARSGPIPGSLPGLNECDDMLRLQHRVIDSMARIKDVIVKQEAEVAEQRKYDEQRHAANAGSKYDTQISNGSYPSDSHHKQIPPSSVGPSHPHLHRLNTSSSSASASTPPTSLDKSDSSSSLNGNPTLHSGRNALHSGNSHDSAGVGSGGFAGADAKKRRGRAAPPGRCHSCNRAETPEWRRGPDGARTLCNACGLHYAKLTRKMGGAHAAGTNGGGNLTHSVSNGSTINVAAANANGNGTGGYNTSGLQRETAPEAVP